jgi:hypothetical protein
MLFPIFDGLLTTGSPDEAQPRKGDRYGMGNVRGGLSELSGCP